MRKFTIFVSAVALTVSAGAAFAGEGNGNPFPSQNPGTVVQGPAFVTETGTAAYPTAAGNRSQASSLGQLVPAPGNERIVQSYFEAGVARPAG